MSRHVVCRVEELPPGARKIVNVRGRTIGVFNVNGAYYALLNRCPHLAAPLCKGVVTGLITGPEPYKIEFSRDGEVLRCPWHGWEFDITNGQSVFNPHRVRVKSYDVLVETQRVEATDAEAREAAAAGTDRATIGEGDPDPSLETFPVAVEQQHVVLYLGQSKPAGTTIAPGPEAQART
jgi:nitrite reductase/ring-hydroxylating ferredoxin subunit